MDAMGALRRVPLRLVASAARACRPVVEVSRDRAEHAEGCPEDWAAVPVASADDWDATCWRPVSAWDGAEDWSRPELLPVRGGRL